MDILFFVYILQIIDIDASSVSMVPTKTEIKLKKKELGSWSTLEIPRKVVVDKKEEPDLEENISAQVDAVDLSDI